MIRCSLAVLCVLTTFVAALAHAEKRYGPGVTDTEILLGQTMPYSGPASTYGTYGKAQLAFLRMINEHGGVNFVTSGAAEFADPKTYPWTMGWRVNYVSEAKAYAKYLLQARPSARIAVLYQHDDVGKDYMRGLREGLGGSADKMIVAEASFEITDPTVDSQIVTLQASAADTLFIFSSAKPAAQAIRKVWDVGWRPLQFVGNPAASVATVMRPAGLEKSVGIISGAFLKDPTDSHWQNDPGRKEWLDFMKQYYPEGDVTDLYNVYAYATAQTLVQVLKQCGDDLTRENLVRQAANLNNLELPILIPGIRINTGPHDYSPVEQMQLQRFDGKQWVLFGDIITP